MAKLTRRGLLKQATVGVGVVGVVAGVVACGSEAHAAALGAPEVASSAANDGLIVAYIRNPKTGEVGILSGEQEHIVTDMNLVNRLLKA